jgi:hypothetical protein
MMLTLILVLAVAVLILAVIVAVLAGSIPFLWMRALKMSAETEELDANLSEVIRAALPDEPARPMASERRPRSRHPSIDRQQNESWESRGWYQP